ncbi:MAG: hydrogenase formation protein HypD [Lentisphaerae bacterium]|nr:hydrogenase formation protein HypD [Lentisphaerota bacterium]
MKYVDEFRASPAAAPLRARLGRLGEALSARPGTVNIMEICGSHTMAAARYGLRDLLPPRVRLISGPGCPVCVTPPGYVDAAIELAGRGVTIATFGDMLQVPGSSSSLAQARAAGARIEVCYSPRRALELAAAEPAREVVFLAIGFETTIAPVASLVDLAARERVANLSLLVSFKLVPPALRAVLADPDLSIDAFLCPGHVSAITGTAVYEPFARDRGKPCVIAGFEPLDILFGLCGILAQLAEGRAAVENLYRRAARDAGNPIARAVMERFLRPAAAYWRGIGVLPESGLVLRDEFAAYDAEKRFGLKVGAGREYPGCMCGDVIKGKRLPAQCPLFAKRCTPADPVGPCMVSAEGSCAASYKYERKGGR